MVRVVSLISEEQDSLDGQTDRGARPGSNLTSWIDYVVKCQRTELTSLKLMTFISIQKMRDLPKSCNNILPVELKRISFMCVNVMELHHC